MRWVWWSGSTASWKSHRRGRLRPRVSAVRSSPEEVEGPAASRGRRRSPDAGRWSPVGSTNMSFTPQRFHYQKVLFGSRSHIDICQTSGPHTSVSVGGKRMGRWSSGFEQSPALHTGQVRARLEWSTPDAGAQTPQSEQALAAEPGVPAMSDKPDLPPGQGPARPARR